MNVKRIISIVMVSIMILSAFPTVVNGQAIQNNPPGIEIPEGFSLHYIGRYHEASPVINGMIAVSNGEYSIYGNYKKPVWGFVNAKTGKEVVAPQYTHDGYAELEGYLSQFVRYPHYYGNVVVLRDWYSATVLDKQGKTVVPYGKYRYISSFIDGYAEVVTFDYKWGIINEKGEEMFPLEKYMTDWGHAGVWGPSGIIPVYLTDNGMATAINVFGEELITPSHNLFWDWPMDGYIVVFDWDNIEGYVIDKTGKKLFTYEEGRVLRQFSEGLCYYYQFKPNSLRTPADLLYSGFIDTTGKEIFRLPQDYIISPFAPAEYKNGLVKVESYDPTNPYRSGSDHLFDITGKEVFKTYGHIDDVGNGFAQVFMPVFEEGEYIGDVEMLYNIKTGKSILPEGYKLAGEIEKKLGREVGVEYQTGLEPNGDLIAIVEDVEFEAGLPDDIFFEKLEQLKRGYINANGEIVVPPGKYKKVEPFTYGKGRVQDYNGKWGFVDNKGKEIIKPQFDVVTYFVEDKAVVGIFTDEKAPNAGNDYLSLGKPVHDYITDWYILVDETYASAKTKSSVSESSVTEKAVPTTSNVLVNGISISFEAYTINGNNYFKLRDLAQAVNNTEKNFDVTWDGLKNAINLISNKPYSSVGGELAKGDGTAKIAIPTSSKIYKDGKEIALTAYTINGNNYFKLRDIAKAFDIGVTWDSATNTVSIDTSIGYVEE